MSGGTQDTGEQDTGDTEVRPQMQEQGGLATETGENFGQEVRRLRFESQCLIMD